MSTTGSAISFYQRKDQTSEDNGIPRPSTTSLINYAAKVGQAVGHLALDHSGKLSVASFAGGAISAFRGNGVYNRLNILGAGLAAYTLYKNLPDTSSALKGFKNASLMNRIYNEVWHQEAREAMKCVDPRCFNETQYEEFLNVVEHQCELVTSLEPLKALRALEEGHKLPKYFKDVSGILQAIKNKMDNSSAITNKERDDLKTALTRVSTGLRPKANLVAQPNTTLIQSMANLIDIEIGKLQHCSSKSDYADIATQLGNIASDCQIVANHLDDVMKSLDAAIKQTDEKRNAIHTNAHKDMQILKGLPKDRNLDLPRYRLSEHFAAFPDRGTANQIDPYDPLKGNLYVVESTDGEKVNLTNLTVGKVRNGDVGDGRITYPVSRAQWTSVSSSSEVKDDFNMADYDPRREFYIDYKQNQLTGRNDIPHLKYGNTDSLKHDKNNENAFFQVRDHLRTAEILLAQSRDIQHYLMRKAGSGDIHEIPAEKLKGMLTFVTMANNHPVLKTAAVKAAMGQNLEKYELEKNAFDKFTRLYALDSLARRQANVELMRATNGETINGKKYDGKKGLIATDKLNQTNANDALKGAINAINALKSQLVGNNFTRTRDPEGVKFHHINLEIITEGLLKPFLEPYSDNDMMKELSDFAANGSLEQFYAQAMALRYMLQNKHAKIEGINKKATLNAIDTCLENIHRAYREHYEYMPRGENSLNAFSALQKASMARVRADLLAREAVFANCQGDFKN